MSINQLFLNHFVKIGRFYVLSEAIVPRKGERIREDSPSERKTDRPTHQKSPIEVQIHILVHTNKEKQESQTHRKEKKCPTLFSIKKPAKKKKGRKPHIKEIFKISIYEGSITEHVIYCIGE